MEESLHRGTAGVADYSALFSNPAGLGFYRRSAVAGEHEIPRIEADYAALKRLWDSVVKAADERGGGELDGVV